MFLEEKKQSSIIQTARVQKDGHSRNWPTMGCQVQTINKIENARYSPNCDILYSLLECLDLTLKINNEKL
jgi:ribosome-binding protein aMBF1 (putative translation factor)